MLVVLSCGWSVKGWCVRLGFGRLVMCGCVDGLGWLFVGVGSVCVWACGRLVVCGCG